MQATRNIADAALSFKRLRGFVHLSTAYVNCNRPHGSHVEERLYRFHADKDADDSVPSEACSDSSRRELEGVEALAQELAALPEGLASQRVSNFSASPLIRPQCSKIACIKSDQIPGPYKQSDQGEQTG